MCVQSWTNKQCNLVNRHKTHTHTTPMFTKKKKNC